MRLITLSDPVLLLEQHMNSSRTILRESCKGLTKEQQRIVEGIYNEFKPLIEASLTADQIKGIFQQLEKSSVEGGANRTLAGKGVDTAKKANEIINNVGKWLQDTTPVKMADQKFEQLKAKVGAKFPDLDKQLTGLGTWMKENPGKSAAIIGVLTALASLAGGPVGGAIAGQVLRGSAELIKGEKLSTAVGKGIKTAVFGYLSGKAFEMLGQFAQNMRIKSIPFGPEDAGLERISYGATKAIRAPGMEWTQSIEGVNILVDPEMASAIRSANTLLAQGGEAAVEGFDQLKAVADIINSPEYRKEVGAMMKGAFEATKNNDSLLKFITAAKEGLQAASQGAIAAAGDAKNVGKGQKESYYTQTRPLSEGQVYMLFDRVLTEAGILDKLKSGAGKAMGAVGKGAQWAGKQATEKVTSAKLIAAWKLEGSPTDSEELKKFLLDFGGIDANSIDKVYTDMKLPTGTNTAAAQPTAARTQSVYMSVKNSLDKLNKKDKTRLISFLKQSLGTA